MLKEKDRKKCVLNYNKSVVKDFMKNYYCAKCGYKNVYQLDKPRFCGSCGTEMGKLKASNCKTKPKVKASLSVDDFEIVDDDYDSQPSRSSKNPFSADSFSVQASNPSVLTLEQIKETSHIHNREDLKFERPKDNRSSEEIMSEFRKEASGRSQSSEIGG